MPWYKEGKAVGSARRGPSNSIWLGYVGGPQKAVQIQHKHKFPAWHSKFQVPKQEASWQCPERRKAENAQLGVNFWKWRPWILLVEFHSLQQELGVGGFEQAKAASWWFWVKRSVRVIWWSELRDWGDSSKILVLLFCLFVETQAWPLSENLPVFMASRSNRHENRTHWIKCIAQWHCAQCNVNQTLLCWTEQKISNLECHTLLKTMWWPFI